MGRTARTVTWGAVSVLVVALALGTPLIASWAKASSARSSVSDQGNQVDFGHGGNPVGAFNARRWGVALLSSKGRLVSSSSFVSSPRLVPELSNLIPGERVDVEGLNFPSHALVNLELCGLDGYSASDCLSGGAVSTVASGNGFFVTPIVVGVPPVDCPCVIQAVGPALPAPVSAPITLEGVPVSKHLPKSDSSGSSGVVEIEHVSVSGSGPWQAWFGGSPRRKIVLEIENTTTRTRPVSLRMELGDGRLIGHPRLGDVPAGAKRRFTLLVSLPALSFGSKLIEGKLATSEGLGASSFDARVFSVPWALLALIWLVFVAAIAFLIDRSIASPRSGDTEQPDPLGTLPPPVGPPVWPGSSPPPTTRVQVVPPGPAPASQASGLQGGHAWIGDFGVGANG